MQCGKDLFNNNFTRFDFLFLFKIVQFGLKILLSRFFINRSKEVGRFGSEYFRELKLPVVVTISVVVAVVSDGVVVTTVVDSVVVGCGVVVSATVVVTAVVVAKCGENLNKSCLYLCTFYPYVL